MSEKEQTRFPLLIIKDQPAYLAIRENLKTLGLKREQVLKEWEVRLQALEDEKQALYNDLEAALRSDHLLPAGFAEGLWKLGIRDGVVTAEKFPENGSSMEEVLSAIKRVLPDDATMQALKF